ncbi:hypothetical protein B0H16DRAFT_1764477 [Mycena metata]|uniref:Uncharacterized protein n=1 Tax=Mycena metata TaxID=1033252 RepID=A0AAD7MWZ0_9AGAR|nr:hypothetical protein B0H16DRAFT_1764477 [Mycena metata]
MHVASYHTLKQPGLLDAFRAAFLRHGIVGSLVAGMCSLTCTMPDHSNGVGVLALAANLVGELIFAPPGIAWVSDALRAGFLPVFLQAAHTRSEHDDDEEILKMLRQAFEQRLTLFSGYTVYRSILILMPKILAKVDDFVKSEAFMNSQVFAPWQAFQALVEDRLTLLRKCMSNPNFNAALSAWISIIVRKHARSPTGAQDTETFAGTCVIFEPYPVRLVAFRLRQSDTLAPNVPT